MDPMGDDQNELQYQGSGAIPALAEEEMGEDDEYDDLYNDVNVGENFMQMHGAEVQPPPSSAGNGGFQGQNARESRVEPGSSQGQNIPGNAAGASFLEQNDMPAKGLENRSVSYSDGLQRGRTAEMPHESQVRNMGFQGSTSGPPNMGVHSSDMARKMANDPAPMQNAGSSGRPVPQMPNNQMVMSADVSRPVMNENQVRAPVENGPTMLFVGELHWWTTDAQLESSLSQYGRVKEIKFFEEKASGKSKGYCQVEFHDSSAAAACKEGMNGHVFNGRPCVVTFASPQTLKQMGSSYMNNSQGQSQNQGRRSMNEGGGRGGNMNYQGGGRGGWGRGGSGGQGIINRAPGGGGSGRGRGGMGAKPAGVGSGANGGGYGQGLGGPPFGGPPVGMMPPHAMMGAGFDPSYIGRGAGYGGFAGPGFPGMLPSFPPVNTMGLAGVAPHVNPAFFGRGMAPNGMGMMGSSGMEGPNAGMWSETNMGGWGEEHGRRTRESSYGGEDGASEYGYGEVNNEKAGRSSAASREKERASDREWSEHSNRRHRDDRDQEYDRDQRKNKEHRYREEKESHRDHRQRERDSGYEDDWDRRHSSSRTRSRSRADPEEEHRSRSRDVDYGKRRRPSD